ncbi:MAG: TIGR04211 family SH3 domain-containing protein [Desulfobacterales bacterium]
MKSWGFRGLSVIAFLLFSTGAPAETRYIKTIVKITLRTGPGLDHKIISMISSGKSVEVLETESGWARVQTEKGQIGWIMTSLISAEKPPVPMSETPNAGDEALLEQQASLYEEINALKAENKSLASKLAVSRSALTENRKALDASRKSSQTARDTSGEIQKLKSDLGKANAALKKLEEKLRHPKSQIIGSNTQPGIYWFLSGGGVLILGFLMGYSRKRQRRSSLLM